MKTLSFQQFTAILILLLFICCHTSNNAFAQNKKKKFSPSKTITKPNLKAFNPTLLASNKSEKITAFVMGSSSPVEIEVKRKDNLILWQGDIHIRNEDVLKHNNMVFSSVVNFPGNMGKWPNSEMPYDEESLDLLNATTKQTILRAIDHINEKTNICIVPRSNQAKYVTFRYVNNPNICGSSPLGAPVFGNVNTIHISSASEPDFGCMVHELLHSIGVNHEQCRHDRDSYVSILWKNIQLGSQFQFITNPFSRDVGAYDFRSIMHYPATAFGKPCSSGSDCIRGKLRTIRPKNSRVSNLGQRNGLSDGDIGGINSLYPTANTGCIDDCNSEEELCVGDTKRVRIYANRLQNWTDIKLKKGQRYWFSCSSSDVWENGNRSSNADGYSHSSQSRTRQPNYRLMTLVGEFYRKNRSIAPGNYMKRHFKIGLSRTYTASDSGYLMCIANDNGLFYGDNSGSIVLTITRIE